MNSETEDRRPRLTRFLTQELLYEYISGSLHPARHRLVEGQLDGDRESQRELLNLSKGLEYAHEIGRLKVSPALHHALLNFEPAWKKHARAWTRWSARHGWRVFPYAFGCTAVALTLVVTKPWVTARNSEVTLASQPHTEPRSLEKTAPREPAATEVAPVVASAPPSTPPPVEVAAKAPPAPAPAPTVEKGHQRGQLMRGELTVRNFDKAWPAIRDKIIALGGGAAGNVELGWLRRKDQSYFHFSIPQSNEDQLNTFLATFGQVQIKPEPSPRVMPQGQIRIILTVKDGGVHEGPAETP